MCSSNKRTLRRNVSTSELVSRPGGEAEGVERWPSQMTLDNNKGLLCHFQSQFPLISLEISYNLRSSRKWLILDVRALLQRYPPDYNEFNVPGPDYPNYTHWEALGYQDPHHRNMNTRDWRDSADRGYFSPGLYSRDNPMYGPVMRRSRSAHSHHSRYRHQNHYYWPGISSQEI